MADMNEADPVFLFSQGFEDSIDSVSGQAKDGVNSPGEQAFHKHIGCVLHQIHFSGLSGNFRTDAWTPIGSDGFLDRCMRGWVSRGRQGLKARVFCARLKPGPVTNHPSLGRKRSRAFRTQLMPGEV